MRRARYTFFAELGTYTCTYLTELISYVLYDMKYSYESPLQDIFTVLSFTTGDARFDDNNDEACKETCMKHTNFVAHKTRGTLAFTRLLINTVELFGFPTFTIRISPSPCMSSLVERTVILSFRDADLPRGFLARSSQRPGVLQQARLHFRLHLLFLRLDFVNPAKIR